MFIQRLHALIPRVYPSERTRMLSKFELPADSVSFNLRFASQNRPPSLPDEVVDYMAAAVKNSRREQASQSVSGETLAGTPVVYTVRSYFPDVAEAVSTVLEKTRRIPAEKRNPIFFQHLFLPQEKKPSDTLQAVRLAFVEALRAIEEDSVKYTWLNYLLSQTGLDDEVKAETALTLLGAFEDQTYFDQAGLLIAQHDALNVHNVLTVFFNQLSLVDDVVHAEPIRRFSRMPMWQIIKTIGVNEPEGLLKETARKLIPLLFNPQAKYENEIAVLTAYFDHFASVQALDIWLSDPLDIQSRIVSGEIREGQHISMLAEYLRQIDLSKMPAEYLDDLKETSFLMEQAIKQYEREPLSVEHFPVDWDAAMVEKIENQLSQMPENDIPMWRK